MHPRARAESGTGCTCVAGARRGGLPGRSAGRRALAVPGGGLARQVAGSPCLELYWLPPSPLTRARRAPFPAGRGIPKVYFAGGFAPGTPALNRLRHLQTPPCRSPAGDLPGRSPARPTFSFISFPHPPAPLRGRGSPKVYFAGGFAPGTPALNRLRHLQTLPYRNPAGGLPGRSAADLAFSFISFPHPPAPPSRREGGF